MIRTRVRSQRATRKRLGASRLYCRGGGTENLPSPEYLEARLRRLLVAYRAKGYEAN